MSEPLELHIHNLDYGERFIVTRETRHGKEGYRVGRYLCDQIPAYTWTWDESYQFYTNLNDLFSSIEKRDYTAACTAF